MPDEETPDLSGFNMADLAEGLLQYVKTFREDPARLASHEQKIQQIQVLTGELVALYMTARLAGNREDKNMVAQCAMFMSIKMKTAPPDVVQAVIGRILDLYVDELIDKHGSIEKIAEIAAADGKIFVGECEHIPGECRCPSKMNEMLNDVT